MIVCHCHVVNDAAIAGRRPGRRADPCRTCAARRGPARDCGGCVFSVRRLVCEHVANPGHRECRSHAMRPVDPRVVELLNDALTFELKRGQQVLPPRAHPRQLGLSQAGQGVLRPVDRRDAATPTPSSRASCSSRATPTCSGSTPSAVGEDAEEMLRLALESEHRGRRPVQLRGAGVPRPRRPRHGRGLRGDGARRGEARRLVRVPRSRRLDARRPPAVPLPADRRLQPADVTRGAGLRPGAAASAPTRQSDAVEARPRRTVERAEPEPLVERLRPGVRLVDAQVHPGCPRPARPSSTSPMTRRPQPCPCSLGNRSTWRWAGWSASRPASVRGLSLQPLDEGAVGRGPAAARGVAAPAAQAATPSRATPRRPRCPGTPMQ